MKTFVFAANPVSTFKGCRFSKHRIIFANAIRTPLGFKRKQFSFKLFLRESIPPFFDGTSAIHRIIFSRSPIRIIGVKFLHSTRFTTYNLSLLRSVKGFVTTRRASLLKRPWFCICGFLRTPPARAPPLDSLFISM